MAERRAHGVAAGLLDADDASKAYRLSMGVAPDYRQLGIGQQLVSAVIDWAQRKQAKAVHLMVTRTYALTNSAE